MNYNSQYGQDKYLNFVFFKSGRSGFFIEIGADDGIDKSNTLFFEKKGWKGLCIEPSPIRFKSLIKNRKCKCFNGAIGETEGKTKFLDITGYGKGLSGIINKYHEKHLKRISGEIKNDKTESINEIEVDVTTMQNLLDQFQVLEIDYFSLDVEGAEYSILKSIDFNKSYIKVFSIEKNYEGEQIHDFLISKNFLRFANIGRDEIYVNKSFIHPWHYVNKAFFYFAK